MECNPNPNIKENLIGPFKTIEDRDSECSRLEKEEYGRTRRRINRMTMQRKSYFRTNVVIREDEQIKKAA